MPGRPKLRRNAPRITDPFAVIPEKPENIEVQRDSRGILHLRLNVELTALKRKIANLLHYDYTRKLELDETGTFFYDLVDGRTALDTIVDKMAKKLRRSRKDTEGMVVLFTRKLMGMGMIVLKVPESAQSGRADEKR